MNVLILAKAFPPNLGGVETVSEEIAAAYARAGANVRVITQFVGNVGEEVRIQSGGTFRVFNVGPGSQLAVFARMLRVVMRLLSEQPADITHATTWRVLIPAIVAKLLGRKIGKRIVMVHGREILQTRGVLTGMMRLIFWFVDRPLVISQYARDICQKKLPILRSIGVVSWNGISWPDEVTKSNYEIDKAAPIQLLAASQHTRRKNIAAAIRAVSLLSSKHGMIAHLTVVGDGPERRNLEQLCEALGLRDRVKFLGKIERAALPNYYKAADVFVHPHSHSHDATDVETFCLAVADGMALGVPVISGRDGAPAEYIINGVNGFLVEGGNPEELADTIAYIVGMDASQRFAIGRYGASFCARSFSWDRHILPALELGPALGSTVQQE